MMTAAESHQGLVQELIDDGVLKTPRLIDAFRAIDRMDFVTPAAESEAYLNIPLPIGDGQTISQPYTVAFMLELLQPQLGDHILDVGCGSGWQTALLAHTVGEQGNVTGLEIISSLCEQGRQNVATYNFIEKRIVEIHCQDARNGYSAGAPYDNIIAAAAGHDVPTAWQEQLKVGGRIVTPVGSSVMRLTRVNQDQWEREDFPGFAFVPLV